jgi:glycyl-tRNA synthetase alpha subunit
MQSSRRPPARTRFGQYLTRRANHRHIFIVARIKPAPENPLRAF